MRKSSPLALLADLKKKWKIAVPLASKLVVVLASELAVVLASEPMDVSKHLEKNYIMYYRYI